MPPELIRPEWFRRYAEHEPSTVHISLVNGWDMELESLFTKLESAKHLQQCSNSKYGIEIENDRVEIIATSIKHANAFFRESYNNSFDVKPTTLFYACAHLARGLAFYNPWDNHPSTFKPSHGMTFKTDGTRIEKDVLSVFRIGIEEKGTMPDFYNRCIVKTYFDSEHTHIKTLSYGLEYHHTSFPDLDIITIGHL